MLPIIELTVNSLTLFALVIVSALAGFAIRSWQISKKNSRIAYLENEMMRAHAETLQAQRDYFELESRMRDLKIPVIAMTHSGKEDGVSGEQRPVPAPLRKDRPNRTA